DLTRTSPRLRRRVRLLAMVSSTRRRGRALALADTRNYRRNLHVGPAMASVLPLVMGGPVPRQFRWMRSSRSIYAAVVVFVLAVFALSGFFFARAIRVEERDYLAKKDALARCVAATILAREYSNLSV